VPKLSSLQLLERIVEDMDRQHGVAIKVMPRILVIGFGS
jgi:hypothetical protein